jgi:hypothetical protein
VTARRGPGSDRPLEQALNPVSHRRREHAVSGPRTAPQKRPAPDTADDVVRWAAFCCVLVPVVLVWYGTSLAAAISTALGLAAVTTACRALLKQSERGAARLRAEELTPHRGRHSRTGTGAHRGGRHSAGNTPVD